MIVNVVVLLLLYGLPIATQSLALDHLAVNRRDALLGASSLVVTCGWTTTTVQAIEESNTAAPIAILGASGRTGTLCVTACLKRGIPVRALTRTGMLESSSFNDLVSSNNKLLTVQACDVRDSTAIARGVRGCRGVIYAASASKQGGDAHAIDNVGVVAAAQASIDAKVARYIVISSTATTRPNSLGYIFTNVMGGIMDEKRQGEEAVERLYQNLAADENNRSTKCSYTIVRPGGLEEPKKNEVLGPASLEVSQGDVLAGIVSRADLAFFSVALATASSDNLKNTALEVYYTNSVQPCEGKFKKLLQNGQAPRFHGNSYDELLQNVQPGVDYYSNT